MLQGCPVNKSCGTLWQKVTSMEWLNGQSTWTAGKEKGSCLWLQPKSNWWLRDPLLCTFGPPGSWEIHFLCTFGSTFQKFKTFHWPKGVTDGQKVSSTECLNDQNTSATIKINDKLNILLVTVRQGYTQFICDHIFPDYPGHLSIFL